MHTRRLMMSLFGVAITGGVVGVWNFMPLGADPFTVFVNGIANLFNTTYGNLYVIITFVLLLFVFLINKKYIGIATIFNLLFIGVIADIVNNFLIKVITETLPFFVMLIIMVINLIILCFASSLYITANLGVSAYDAISLIISEKKRLSFRICRTITDGVCVTIGYILGAKIGIATVITAFFMGVFIHWFNINISEKLLPKE